MNNIAINSANYFAHPEVTAEIREFGALNDAIGAFASKTASIVDQFAEKYQADNIRSAARAVIEHYKSAQRSAIEYDERLTLNITKFEALPPVVDHSVEQAYRDEFRALALPAKLDALLNWPVAAVIAVLRLDRSILGLTADQAELGLAQVRSQNLIESSFVRAQFPLKPSLEDPLARGVNLAALEAYAAEAELTWAHRKDVVELARQQLQSACVIVAAATETRPEAAYEFLTGAA